MTMFTTNLIIVLCISYGAYTQSIETKFACEGEVLSIKCQYGEVLNILSANYGRSTSLICDHNQNTICYSSNTLSTLTQCNGKRVCLISAENQVFGDPCSGIHKYLTATYVCSKAPACETYQYRCPDGACIDQCKVCNGIKDCSDGSDEIGCKYKTTYICEGDNATLSCPKGELLRIVNADYGRTEVNLCHPYNNTNCHSPGAYTYITKKCDLEQACTIKAANIIFGDPCVGTYKYVTVDYYCWKIPPA